MRFLIISKNKHLTPPEVVPGLIDATLFTEPSRMSVSNLVNSSQAQQLLENVN
jgi:hypothetical protein